MINGINPQNPVYKTSSADSNKAGVQNDAKTNTTVKTTTEDELQELDFDEEIDEINETEDTGKTEEEEALDKVDLELQKSEKKYADKIENCYKQIEQLNKQLETLDLQRRSITQQLFAGGDTQAVMSGLSQLNNQKMSIMNDITSILFNIENLETALKESRVQAQENIDKINDIISQKQAAQNIQTALTNTSGAITDDMGMGDIIATLGNSFVGVINSDAEGNAAFSNGVSQHWCADFVTSIVKMACESTGKGVPNGFGSSSVSGLMEWSKSNGTFLQTAGKADKAQIIAKEIKPGDILIQKENGASHTGIVTKVYPDGSYDTVEGNSSDAVKNRHYSANDNKLTGFIKMT